MVVNKTMETIFAIIYGPTNLTEAVTMDTMGARVDSVRTPSKAVTNELIRRGLITIDQSSGTPTRVVQVSPVTGDRVEFRQHGTQVLCDWTANGPEPSDRLIDVLFFLSPDQCKAVLVGSHAAEERIKWITWWRTHAELCRMNGEHGFGESGMEDEIEAHPMEKSRENREPAFDGEDQFPLFDPRP